LGEGAVAQVGEGGAEVEAGGQLRREAEAECGVEVGAEDEVAGPQDGVVGGECPAETRAGLEGEPLSPRVANVPEGVGLGTYARAAG
jgi:hypothetical protein